MTPPPAVSPSHQALAEANAALSTLLSLPPCCQAAAMRTAADLIWETNPDAADRYEAYAARLLLAGGYPTSRDHDPLTCQERTDR